MEDLEKIFDNIPYIGEKGQKCPYCGKPYKTKLLTPFRDKPDKNRMLEMPDCNCESEHARAAKEKAYEESLKELAKKRIEKMFTNSMMTPFFREKKFENLDMNDNLRFCQKYANEFDTKTSKGLQFIGNVGTGKTTSLACICNQLIENGHPCLFTTFSDLLDRFAKHSYDNAGDVSTLLEDLCKCDFIVLDDLGRETYTEKRKELAFKIIDKLLNYKVITAITANPESILKLSNIKEWEPILDRLKDICPISLQFDKESMRGKLTV